MIARGFGHQGTASLIAPPASSAWGSKPSPVIPNAQLSPAVLLGAVDSGPQRARYFTTLRSASCAIRYKANDTS
jgi:hypothetical protein